MSEKKESQSELEKEEFIPKDSSEEMDEQTKIIDFSKRVVSTLDNKTQTHNQKNPENTTSLPQLKKVFNSGAKNFSKEEAGEINVYAMARVNMFLRTKEAPDFKELLASGIKTEKADEIQIEKLSFEESEKTQTDTSVDASENWIPNNQDFELAKLDVEKNNLDYSFSDINELYIDFDEEALGISIDYL